MPFSNKYTSPGIIVSYAQEFLESETAFVYAVGKDENGLPVILKSDTSGNTIWHKQISEQTGMKLVKVLQLSIDGSFRYIVSGTRGASIVLFSLNPSGTLVWAKKITTNGENLPIFTDNVPAGNGFYLAWSNPLGPVGTPMLKPLVLRFNIYGTVVNGKFILQSGGVINAVVSITDARSHSNGYTLAGTHTSSSTAVIIDLTPDLTIASSRRISIPFPGGLQQVFIRGAGDFIVTGYSNASNGVYIARVNGFGSMTMYLFPNSIGHASVLTGNSELLYISLYTATQGRIYRGVMNTSFTMQWVRELRENETPLPVKTLIYRNDTSRLTATAYENNHVILTDAALTSCLTQGLDSAPLVAGTLTAINLPVYVGPYSPDITNISLTLVDQYSNPEVVCGTGIDLSDAMLQSSHLYLQAAGSQGVDSTEGIHLRWMLRNGLAKHLPKANYATTTENFNKPDDFVRIYRAPYQELKVRLDLTTPPQLVDDVNSHWLYTVDDKAFDVWFRNTARYASVRAGTDPYADPVGFFLAYGDQLIEVEQKTDLAFAVTLYFYDLGSPNNTAIELLSVAENAITSPKRATYRKKHAVSSDVTGKKLLSENIRSVRFRSSAGLMYTIEFEFYSKFIQATSDEENWNYTGQHALTLDTNVAFYRLEPVSGSVDGKWLRYNDQAWVRTANYHTKWNSSSLDPDTRIQDTVERYITLSDSAANPEAIETIYFNDPNAPAIPGYEPDPDFDPSENQFKLSNMYVLQLASMDYHIARMLGLGVLDLSSTIYSGEYMYLAEYVSFGDLNDGLGAREVRHLYCSLPTALTDERLPVPVDLKVPVPGIFQGLGTETPGSLTDAGGYSVNGKTRFISLFNEDLPEEDENAAFFYQNVEFISAESTLPVNAGIEYRPTGTTDWQKPELPFDTNYFNIDVTVPDAQSNETRPVIIPEPGYPVFIHREKTSGWHDYSSYGINWFSRATASDVIHSIETTIVPENLLQPPTNINAVLIRPESPLLLTSADEQAAYAAITTPDKTFIRLTFDYNHGQEMIDYHKEINGELINGYAELPDNDELFAEAIELFFRNEIPNSVSGKIVSVADDTNPLLSVITTGQYELLSVTPPDNLITPQIPAGLASNFIGSALTVNGEVFIIHTVDNTGLYPKFTVFKNDANGFPVALTTSLTPGELNAPSAGGLFIAVENMLSTASWSSPNPLIFSVNVDQTTVHHETVTVRIPDGSNETHEQKFRGVYENAFVEKILEDHDGNPGTANIHLGLYKLTFTNPLAQHSQAGGTTHRVEWHKGVVRVHTISEPNGPRRNLQVLSTEHVGSATDLVVYAVDAAFDAADPLYDQIATGMQSVNYYPGYRVYLREDGAYGLNQPAILPGPAEDIRYSIFGLRSRDSGLNYVSKISQPVLMFAQKIEEPLAPRTPVGGPYTTRPDFFGKASYTFTTVYDHKPYSVQFGRASDIQILTALWRNDTPADPLIWTVQRIQDEILERGEAIWYNGYWQNLLGFDYTYPADAANNGFFERFPDSSGTSLPLPNNADFIDAINVFIDQHNDTFGTGISPIAGITSLYQVVIPSGPQNVELQITDFVRDVVHNCFVPLTEVPIVYQYIKALPYSPIPKKQVIRDERGDLLKPSDPEFDMAPMMKITGPDLSAAVPKTDHETQFTDFGLDGASNAKYFYIAREFSLQMKTGPYSPILGPINLVNAAPPRAPEVVKIVPVLENRNLNIAPAIELNLNAYAAHQRIRKITVYRATSLQNALSVRTMEQVKVVDFATDPVVGETWSVKDDFSDLSYIPYGDPLFYILTVSREVKYNDRDGNPVTEYQPSGPSKLTVTNIVESYNPDSPALSYTADPPDSNNEIGNVEISWTKTVHNGKYHLQKRNEKGNWIEIAAVQSNDVVPGIALAATNLNSGMLALEDANGNRVYHVFKVVSENFAGMLSREEKILSI